ncbi:dipeptidase [Arcicella aurantiaca]|uniref:Dipeptidase n=1 Tax=Arcicella aurantiaca TaxID=591202 RepID=A0A316EGJ4_9BACT|nr:C69 family dipeptidase [Arcicella aurantiaca]PWK29194.1 dipeptidase [Arcicella aurantiaca]
MCDTFIALPPVTKSNSVIFGKNSDREPNEAQAIVRYPRMKHIEETLRCTYIDIPQVEETFEVILSKPFWMWGAEMGVNEYGVTIGNEAIFTKVKHQKTNQGLTGMDLLRLALERSKTADEALKCIIELLQKYGQDACGGYQNRDFYYDNSFIIADAENAFVLETAGNQWVTKKVNTYASISNGLTITDDYDSISEKAITFAQEKGFYKSGKFSFAKVYSDPLMTWVSSCKTRQNVTMKGAEKQGFNIQSAIEILSSHYLSDDKFAPYKATTKDVCMHATGKLNPNSTVGSMIVEIRKDKPVTVWLTGSSNSSLSIYKPFFFGENGVLNDVYQVPDVKFDRKTLWWISERLYRLGNLNYQALVGIVKQEKEQIQQRLIEEEQQFFKGNPTEETLQNFSKNSFQTSFKALIDWNNKASKIAWRPASWNPFYYFFWRNLNKKVGL